MSMGSWLVYIRPLNTRPHLHITWAQWPWDLEMPQHVSSHSPLAAEQASFVIWFGLGFRVWGYRMLNVQEKQNSDLLQFTILPKLTLQLPLSAEHLQGWFLRAQATFIPEERLTQSRDPTELERNHDVKHQTTLVPNSSAICSHSTVLRAGTTSSECSVLQTLTSFFSPLFLLWENHLEDLSSPSRSY